MFPVMVYLIDNVASAFTFDTVGPSCLLHKAGNEIVGCLSLELVDLVVVSSLHLVESRSHLWWGRFVRVTHKDVGVRD